MIIKSDYIIYLSFMVFTNSYEVSCNPYVWLEQMSRHETLQSGCDKFDHDNNNIVNYNFTDEQFSHILVNHRYKLLYCYVPKVACTNWKRVLVALDNVSNNITMDLMSISANFVHSEGTLLKLSEIDESKRMDLLNSYTSFLMVRHPFERLLSAYRNKLEDKDKPSAKYFQSRIGKFIIKKYRKDASSEEIRKGENVTFAEFVRYLIDHDISSDITDDENVNEHWRPIFKLCHPCRLNYTFIGKYERFDDDSRVLLNLIDAPSNIKVPLTKSSRTNELLKYYFQQLSIKDIEQLYRFYELDFKLFDYNLENILGFDIG